MDALAGNGDKLRIMISDVVLVVTLASIGAYVFLLFALRDLLVSG